MLYQKKMNHFKLSERLLYVHSVVLAHAHEAVLRPKTETQSACVNYSFARAITVTEYWLLLTELHPLDVNNGTIESQLDTDH